MYYMKYRDTLYADYGASFGGVKKFAPEGQKTLFNAVYPALPDLKDASIVDIGCGKGEWLIWLQSKGYRNIFGVDVSTSEIKEAFGNIQGVEFIEGEAIAVLGSKEAFFDLVHCKDLIEHLTKDEIVDFLLAIHSALKPDGQVVISTFNAQSPFSSSTWCGDFTHETALTPSSLAQVLRSCGFEAVKIKGYVPPGRGVSGFVRKASAVALNLVTNYCIAVRRGFRKTGDVELSSGMPDMIAVASKPAR